MRYTVDEALCCGHGRCAMAAPDLYQVDSVGVNAAVGQFVEVPAAKEHEARDGADACPEAAIRIFEDGMV